MVWRPLMHVYEEPDAEAFTVEYDKRKGERTAETRSGQTAEEVVSWILEPPELKNVRWYRADRRTLLKKAPESILAAIKARGAVLYETGAHCPECGDTGRLSSGAPCPRCQITG